jgi:hypothetical protein
MTEQMQTAIVADEPALLYALNPHELQVAGKKMADFFVGRRDEMKRLLMEQETAYNHAVDHKWASAALKRACDITKRRLTFYEKAVQAVDAGYLVIPNLPMDVFAIRVARKRPRGVGTFSEDRWNRPDARRHAQEPDLLPAGEGHNVSPIPTIESISNEEHRKSHDGTTFKAMVSHSAPVDWRDTIDFPMALAKPLIMTETQRALGLKLFDEMGIVNDRVTPERRADPIIVGRLRNPRRNRPALSFFIAWAADLSRI